MQTFARQKRWKKAKVGCRGIETKVGLRTAPEFDIVQFQPDGVSNMPAGAAYFEYPRDPLCISANCAIPAQSDSGGLRRQDYRALLKVARWPYGDNVRD